MTVPDVPSIWTCPSATRSRTCAAASKGPQLPVDLVHHGPIDGLAEPVTAVFLGVVDDADRQGQAGQNFARPVALTAQPDQFRAAAPDVEYEGIGLVLVEQRHTAGERELRLFPCRYDLDGQSGILPHTVQEIGAIRCPAARLGRDVANANRPMAPDLAGTDPKGAQSPLDRLIRQTTAGGEPLSEPDDTRKGVDDLEPPAVGLRELSRRQLLVPRSSAA